MHGLVANFKFSFDVLVLFQLFRYTPSPRDMRRILSTPHKATRVSMRLSSYTCILTFLSNYYSPATESCWMFGLFTQLSDFHDDSQGLRQSPYNFYEVSFILSPWGSVKKGRRRKVRAGCQFLSQRLVYLLRSVAQRGWYRKAIYAHSPVSPGIWGNGLSWRTKLKGVCDIA